MTLFGCKEDATSVEPATAQFNQKSAGNYTNQTFAQIQNSFAVAKTVQKHAVKQAIFPGISLCKSGNSNLNTQNDSGKSISWQAVFDQCQIGRIINNGEVVQEFTLDGELDFQLTGAKEGDSFLSHGWTWNANYQLTDGTQTASIKQVNVNSYFDDWQWTMSADEQSVNFSDGSQATLTYVEPLVINFLSAEKSGHLQLVDAEGNILDVYLEGTETRLELNGEEIEASDLVDEFEKLNDF
jgi:hypothetical protein